MNNTFPYLCVRSILIELSGFQSLVGFQNIMDDICRIFFPCFLPCYYKISNYRVSTLLEGQSRALSICIKFFQFFQSIISFSFFSIALFIFFRQVLYFSVHESNRILICFNFGCQCRLAYLVFLYSFQTFPVLIYVERIFKFE